MDYRVFLLFSEKLLEDGKRRFDGVYGAHYGNMDEFNDTGMVKTGCFKLLHMDITTEEKGRNSNDLINEKQCIYLYYYLSLVGWPVSLHARLMLFIVEMRHKTLSKWKYAVTHVELINFPREYWTVAHEAIAPRTSKRRLLGQRARAGRSVIKHQRAETTQL